MNNTGKKILILGIVIAIAIAGILAFYPTIVAPPTDVPVNNLHKSSLEANINGFSDTENTIARLQPDAVVSENGLTIARNDVAGSAEEVAAWAEGLGL